MEYNTQVGIFETGEKDSQGGAYKDNRFLALRKRELNEYEVKEKLLWEKVKEQLEWT